MSRSQNKFTDCANCYYDPSETYYVDHAHLGGWPTSYDALPVSDVESTPCDCQPGVTKPRRHDELQEASSNSVPLLAPWSGRKHRVAAWIGGSRMKNVTAPCSPLASPSWSRRKSLSGESGGPYPYQLSYTSHGGHASKVLYKRHCAARHNAKVAEIRRSSVTMEPSVSGFSRYGSSSIVDATGVVMGRRDAISDTVAAAAACKASRRCRHQHHLETGFATTTGRDEIEIAVAKSRRENVDVVNLSRSRQIRDEFEAGYVEGRRQGRDVAELSVSRSPPNMGSFAQIGDVDDCQGHESVEVNVPMSLRSRENFDVGYEDYLQGHRDVELNLSRSRRSRQDFEAGYKDYLQDHERGELHASRSRRSTGENYEDYRQGHGHMDVGVSRSSCRTDVRCSKSWGRKKKRPRESDVFYLQRRSRLHIGGSEVKMSPRSDTTTDLSALIRRNYRKQRIKAGSSTTSFSVRPNARFKHGASVSPNDSTKHSLSQHLSASNLSGDDLAAVIKARSQSLDARLAAMEQNMFDKERRASLSGGSTVSTTSRRPEEPPVALLEPRVPEDVRTKRLTQEHLVKACSLSAQAIPDATREPATRDAGGDTAKDDETMNGLMTSLEKIGCGHLKVNLKGIFHRLQKTDSKSTAATAVNSKAKTNSNKSSSTTTKTLAADPREAYEEIYKQQSLKCIISKPKLSSKFKPKKDINFEELMKQKIDRSTLGLQLQELWTHSGNFRTATPQSSKTEQDVTPGNQTLSQTLIEGSSAAGGATANDEPGSEVKFEERWSKAADPNTTRQEATGGGGCVSPNQRPETPFERTWTRPTVLDEKPEVPTNLKTVQDNKMRHQKLYGKLENSPPDVQQQTQQHKQPNDDQNLNANQASVELSDAKCQQDAISATVDPQNRNPNPNSQQQQQQQQHSNVNDTNADFREAKRQQDERPPEVQQQQHQQWRQQLNVGTELFREAPRPQDTDTPSAAAQNRGVQPGVQQQHAQYQQLQHQQWCQRLNENHVGTEFVETVRPQDVNRTDARNIGVDAQADNWNLLQQQQQQNHYRVDYRQESWQQSCFPNSPDDQRQPFPADQYVPERQPLGLHSTARQSFAPENNNVANNNNAHQQVVYQNRPATATQVVAELDAPHRRPDDGYDVAREHYARRTFEAYRTSPTDLGLPEVNSQGDWTLQANTSPILAPQGASGDLGGGYPERSGTRLPAPLSLPRDKWMQSPVSQRGEPHLLPTRVQGGHDKWRQHGGNVPPPPPPPLPPPPILDDWFERPQTTTTQAAVVQPQPNFVYRADASQRFPIGDCRRDVKPDYERNAKAMPVRRLVSKMADPRPNKMAATVGTQQLRAQLLRREARKAAASEEARARTRTTLPTNPAPLKFPVFVGNENRVQENWKPKIRVQTKFQDLRPPTETINSKFLVSNQDGWNVQSSNQIKDACKFVANAPVGGVPDDLTKLKTDYYKFWEQSQRGDPNLDVLRTTEYVSYPDTEEYPTAQMVNRQCPPNAPIKTTGNNNYRGFVNQPAPDDLPGGSCSEEEDDDGGSSVQTSKSYMLHMIDQVVSRQAGTVSGERPEAVQQQQQPPGSVARRGGGGGGSYFNLAVDEAIDLVKSESVYGLDQGLCKDITRSLTDSLLGCKSVNSAASCDKCVEVAKKAQWLKEFRCDSLRNISNVVTQLQKLERVTEETHCKDHKVLFPTNIGSSA